MVGLAFFNLKPSTLNPKKNLNPHGATTKGTKVGTENLARAAVMRVLRLAYVGFDAGMMTPHDKYLAGMCSIVVPQIKRELHDAKKVLKPKLRADGKHEGAEFGGSLSHTMIP